MKLPQAPSFSFERFKKELITFPGYAGILLGWFGVVAFFVLSIVSLFVPDQMVNKPVPLEPATTATEPSTTGLIVASVLGLFLVVAMIGALWVYIARYTKTAVRWLAKKLYVADKNYWSFCTIVLIVGWLATSGLVFLASGEEFFDVIAFCAAVAITIGAASFGIAALQDRPKTSKAKKSFKFKRYSKKS
ncbi:MAG: hypothetical protein WBP26_04895 [Candidatus Saccharimonadales bacterium]